ncbi:ATP-dependent helicase HrpB [Chondromyces apiculatus]|uniref:ATP-dependent helicase HrpB n=1 Tax=Chondromyces apiculatus DSM 436 TaxID=1192034 RepID=A0A017SYD0_9BACT|nr:ATP-dependent helicase HrpB [Chondromyces apiculatus]EYF01782.1 ATP-dependent helicase HrpB [Chondromyces apiculatus DSM 436]
MQPLPIDPLLPELCTALQTGRAVVLEAPPGAGKTTRVPRALLDHGFAEVGEILVLEPRRIAARMSARRVAEELGEEVGRRVGYSMRFEEASGPETRIRFITEGVLTRRLLGDPELRGVSAVLLDEFHERHLASDVSLALLRRLLRGPRPDLKVVAMSATLDTGPIAAFLGDEAPAPVLRAEGRMFEVTIEHLPRPDDRPLESQIASAVRQLVQEGLEGDVLVFLPGALEIRRSMEACGNLARSADLLLLPLHGTLGPAEQDRAVRRADRRKVIFSTNVAETSVTIDGVTAVIDSGLARVAAHAPWSGLPTLRLAPISKASAAQRAGRAGRTRPGRCLRLYTRLDLAARPDHEAPEVRRADLAEAVLDLHAAGVTDLARFGWLEAPPTAALTAAEDLLVRLGALERKVRGATPHRAADAGAGALQVTATGRRMLHFPTHPRLSRMIVEAERRGIAGDGCALAALAGEREIGAHGGRRGRESGNSDLLAALELLEEAAGARFDPDRLRWMGVDPTRATAVDRTRRQLTRMADRRAPAPTSAEAREEAQLVAILAGFPDRVGRLRRPQNATGRAGREVVLAAGGTAVLAETSVVDGVELVVAVEVEERSEGGRARAVVRSASAIQADWLLDLFTDAIDDTTEAVWIEASERFEVLRRLSYDGLVLEETRLTTVAEGGAAAKTVAAALAARAKARGWRTFTDGDALERWLARVGFARVSCPELGLPVLGDAEVDEVLEDLCAGRRSFAELRQADLAHAVQARLDPATRRVLDDVAPETIALPGGRKARLDYPPDAPPCLASRLQDFFGMSDGPSVARGRVPVVLHLCAPNQRPVQVTTDLRGFWARHYPAVAKELRRKYPKHAWPDDPLTARPPPVGRPR